MQRNALTRARRDAARSRRGRRWSALALTTVPLLTMVGLLALASLVARARPVVAAPAAATRPSGLHQAMEAPLFSLGRGFNKPTRPPTSAECKRVVHLACYSPLQLEKAYHLRALYAKGFTGKGRTIVIVDPFGSPTIRHDLKVFDHAFGLPAPPRFKVLQPVGRVPPYDPANPEMAEKAGETTGDVETAHAMAPGANILLVETPAAETLGGGGFRRMMAAENYVVKHNLGDVISQSFSLPEQNFPSGSIARLRYAYRNAYRHHLTVLAASNDLGVTGNKPTGPFYQHRVVYWPASDPLNTAVGGTRLHLDAAGKRTSADRAWNESRSLAVATYVAAEPWASNGGVSRLFGRPSYQDALSRIVGDRRGVPDVALSAAFNGGGLVFGSYRVRMGSFRGSSGWGIGGGTSAATPAFAGIVAIADQYAKRRLGLLNPALYRLERQHARGIIDVTKGNNTVSFQVQDGSAVKTFTLKGYRAKPGYDLVTGLGTVDAGRLVPELARR
jgi:subtilase family serine protease